MNREIENILKTVEAEDRILEVGCNHGFHTTLFTTRLSDRGFILGVDAVPENCMIAQSQMALNNVCNKALILNCVVSDSNGKQTVANAINGFIVNKDQKDINGNVLTIDGVSGDCLDDTYGPFNYLKIDVEGFEGVVLRGCQKLLKRTPKIEIEFHGQESIMKYGSSIQEMLGLIDVEQYNARMIVRPSYDEMEFDRETLIKNPSQTMVFFMPKQLPQQIKLHRDG